MGNYNKTKTHMDKDTAQQIRTLAERYETADFLASDPSQFMHRVQGEPNQEAMAFFASCLSYGSRRQFFPKIQFALDRSGGEMHRWIAEGAFLDDIADTRECYYRLHTCHDVRHLLTAYRAMMASHGSMKAFVASHASDGRTAIRALCRYFAAHDASALVPQSDASACKRLCMFLRWMVRDGSPVDLGLWADTLDKRTLVMPLDTHVVQEAMRLGLLGSRTASMGAALRLTDAMRQVFPDDPLRGDFALFGLGVDNA